MLAPIRDSRCQVRANASFNSRFARRHVVSVRGESRIARPLGRIAPARENSNVARGSVEDESNSAPYGRFETREQHMS